jgi:translation elongation factor EF-Tu-like GTPase
MHMSQSLYYLTTALHVSGVTITHLQEHKTTVTTAFTFMVPCIIIHKLNKIQQDAPLFLKS